MNIQKVKVFIFGCLLTLGCFGGPGCLLSEAASVGSSGGVAAPWLVYWDWQAGYKEIRFSKLDSVVVFAAGFDKNDRLQMPQEFNFADLEQLRKRQPSQLQILSVVNDIYTDKRKVLKDAELVKRILSDDGNMERHASKLIELCQEHKFGGLELDYENLWHDEATVRAYTAFLPILRDKAKAAGISLRVVLEVKALRYAEKLPDGIDYVVMLYNLYGGHSGPGPKASPDFIKKACARMNALQGRKSVALAGGGFWWRSDGKVVGITEEQAEVLRAKNKVFSSRDKNSRSLFYSFEDKGHNEVWYADAVTLSYWQEQASKNGYPIVSLWRLGGNL